MKKAAPVRAAVCERSVVAAHRGAALGATRARGVFFFLMCERAGCRYRTAVSARL